MQKADESPKSFLIGICGHYCAGKNYAAKILEGKGLSSLDLDKLGHQALEIKKESIIEKFGTTVLKEDGSVDRRLLGKEVFGNKEKLSVLESIVHPEVNRLTNIWIAEQNGKPCVINAALLHKSSIFEQLDIVILMTSPLITRLLRAKKRDGLTWKEIFRRFSSQKAFNTQYLRKSADIYKVYNGGILSFSRQSLEKQIDKILFLKNVQKPIFQG